LAEPSIIIYRTRNILGFCHTHSTQCLISPPTVPESLQIQKT